MVYIDSWLRSNASAFLPTPSSIGSRESIPSPTIHVCNSFVTICTNNKANYITTSVVEEKKLIADLAWETIELL